MFWWWWSKGVNIPFIAGVFILNVSWGRGSPCDAGSVASRTSKADELNSKGPLSPLALLLPHPEKIAQ
jgi:hypothetical protein